MSRSAAPAGLVALFALAGCFRLDAPSCRVTCTAAEGCPGDLVCLIPSGMPQGLCATPETSMCNPPQVADSGTAAVDSGTNDAEAGRSGAPNMICHNGSCFTLPDAVRSNLVLLLWPSTLPPTVGSNVPVWPDLSGQGNDAHALNPADLPTVIPDGVHLDSTQYGTGFFVHNNPSVDFGSTDFAVIIVSGLSSGGTFVRLVGKSDGARTNSRQITIDWVVSAPATGRPQGNVDDTSISATTDLAQPSVATYTLYRALGHVELHANGVVVGSADLPTPDLSTSNADDLYLGVGSTAATSADSIEAVIAVRGSIGSTDLNNLEDYLRAVFGTTAP